MLRLTRVDNQTGKEGKGEWRKVRQRRKRARQLVTSGRLSYSTGRQSVFQMGGCCFAFSISVCLFVYLYIFDGVDLTTSLPISFFSQEVQTAGARFTKHGPELLEHVVWSQQLWVLRLTDGSSG